MKCILCENSAQPFFFDEKRSQQYFLCETCDLRFLNPIARLNAKEERDRYALHENIITDPGYQKFVDPLFQLITANIPSSAKGLDYGCGEGPVLTHLLSQKGYDVALYDPFFRDDKSVLDRQYDFIFSIEVIEHFFHPADELQKLKEMLRSGGHLWFMTLLYDKSIDFGSWFYRLDPTHVCFFSDETFRWIQKRFGFANYQKVGNRIAWMQ
jgi:2-polyprenyl-3-methyl-5-hydroxy-6-metoxy-1,4-benzoquinol methylase